MAGSADFARFAEEELGVILEQLNELERRRDPMGTLPPFALARARHARTLIVQLVDGLSGYTSADDADVELEVARQLEEPNRAG